MPVILIDTKTIWPKIQQGDTVAFKQVFDAYYASLYHFCYKFLKQPAISEEVVQDVFIYLWDKRASISIESSLQAYLFRATRNKALDYLKSSENQHQLRSESTSTSEESFSEKALTTETPMETLAESELRDLVQKGLASLPEKCREIFLLSRENGMSYAEIASTLGISKKTVENQMGIALRKLKDFLGQHWELFLLLIFSQL